MNRWMNAGRLGWALFGAALLAACSSSSGPKPAELEDIPDAQRVRVKWALDLGTGEPYIFTPAIAGDAVFVAARYGTVARVEAATGRELWRVKPSKTLSAGPGASARPRFSRQGHALRVRPRRLHGDGADHPRKPGAHRHQGQDR